MINQHPIDKLADAFAGIATPVQLAKMVEEVGEAAGAYIGMIGANPRKGETHTMEDFHTELLDVALTALMLYRNTGGGPPLARLSLHIENRWKRHESEVLGKSWRDDGSNVLRDSRGTIVKIRCRVMGKGQVTGQAGTVMGTRSGDFGSGTPEALVRWSDGSEAWRPCSDLTVWMTQDAEAVT